jgi:flavin reductase (DIM6/NTAB) family NADH-FMN oxidoreductase RutF
MDFDFESLSNGQVYACMTQTLTPRPIAWVLSENADGGYNLAPFSYFNAVCSDPPLIMLSIGHKPDGSAKDTRANILQRKHFVVHIAHVDLLDALNASAAVLPAGESELTRLELPTADFDGSPLPRLAQARVAYACSLYQSQEIGPQRQALILGQVHRVFVDDALIAEDAKGRARIDTERLGPLARLGGEQYAELGNVLSRRRPD